MHMARLVSAHKECMVVNVVLATVDVGEDRNILLGSIWLDNVLQVGRDKVEVSGVEVQLSPEVLHAQPVMPELNISLC